MDSPERATSIRLRRDELRNEYKVFGEFKPLKVGIHKDLKASGVELTDVTRKAILYHVRSSKYLNNLLSCLKRYDLKGNESGEITEDQRNDARVRLEKKKERKRRDSAVE